MKTEHPITPPPELVQQWLREEAEGSIFAEHFANQAARWGADQELEACITWVAIESLEAAKELRAARRPKPPSLKEQALLAIDVAVADGRLSPDVSNVVRRALEQLDD